MPATRHPRTDSEHTSPGRAQKSAIQKLPHDTLREIFLEIVSTYHILSRNLGTPAIARVCRDWRATALQDPRLWSTINIPYGESWSSSAENEIRTYLYRSRQLPLHVCATGDMSDLRYDDDQEMYLGGDFGPGDEFAMRAIELIGKLSADRWKSFSLSGHHDIFDRQEKLFLPLLDTIIIAVKASPLPETADPLRLGFLEQAPRVRKITLDVRYLAFSLPAWGSLKEATYLLHHSTDEEFMTVENQIRLQPQLEALEVHDFDGHFGVFAPRVLPIGALIRMPHLTTVTVSGIGHLILTCLDAPSLRNVVVRHGYEEGGPGPLSSIMRLPDKSSLRALELARVELDEDVGMDIVYRCLEGLPALELLRVESSQRFVTPGSILRNDLLVWLARNEAAPVRLPQLAGLFLYFGASRPRGVEERLQKLLESRASKEHVGGVFLRALTRFDTDIGEEFRMA
ncbi:uncharacterized protein SCHCODRAFT_02616944 [Schizophyllum commune H4-8]|nr:uncharacterized protein SCHCODRAFT_02616944 [Schizophyllum commune H4-8]KAI5897227.1 hypothetical protein SCHCODRAFT_02616944 [Schizophyllum commune H4-8]